MPRFARYTALLIYGYSTEALRLFLTAELTIQSVKLLSEVTAHAVHLGNHRIQLAELGAVARDSAFNGFFHTLETVVQAFNTVLRATNRQLDHAVVAQHLFDSGV